MKKSAYSKLTSGDLLGIRKKFNLTQTQIAHRLGLSLRMYRYYEADNRPIPTLVENALGTLEDSQGTLTSYDMDRMKKLREEIDNTLSVGSVDVAHIEKILKQSSKELENVLSKA
jgi:transcriptional regulator with XRE-family HTH domain